MTTDGRNVSLRALSFFFFFFIVVPRVEEARNHFNVCSPLLRHRYTPFLMQGSRHGFSNNIPRTRKSASGINRYWVRRDSYFFFFLYARRDLSVWRVLLSSLISIDWRKIEEKKSAREKKSIEVEDSLLKHFLKIRGHEAMQSSIRVIVLVEF